MAKVIIECETNGEALNLISELIYTINEAKFQSFKDYVESVDRRELDKADFYGDEYKRRKEFIRQIRNRARVEF